VFTSLVAPTGEIEIPEGGIYRLNVKSREAELVVYHGSATIQGQLITESQRAILRGTRVETGPIRWMDIDPFELWSRKRSHFLILALSAAAFHTKIETSKHRPALLPGSVHRVIDSGMWYFFPEMGAYTFVPSDRDRRSPYGPKYEFWFRTN
jgi:hypothetical protein